MLGFVGLVAIGLGVMLLVQRAQAAAPDWASVPILLSLPAIALVGWWLWRRRARAVDGAWLLADADLPLAEQTNAPLRKAYASPDRRFVAVTGANEVRMSIWLESLSLYDVVRNRQALDLPHPWTVSGVAWDADNHLHFSAESYPDRRGSVDVELDSHAGLALLQVRGAATTVVMANTTRALNRYNRRGSFSRLRSRFIAADPYASRRRLQKRRGHGAAMRGP